MTNPICHKIVGAFVAVIAMTASLSAQERFDFSAYLSRLDANQNGILEPGEISGRTRDWLKKENFDVDQPISLKKVAERLEKQRSKREEEDRGRSSTTSKVTLKVPKFGVSDGGNPVPSFGPSDVAPLAAKFSDNVNEQVEETLNRYDKNGNGMLDRDEVKNARWGSPRAEDSDTNGDGKLSRTELANRYHIRDQYRKESESKTSVSSSSSTSSSRDSERGSSRFSSSDRSDRGSDSSSSTSRFSSSSSASSRYTPSRSSSSYSSTSSSYTPSSSSGSSSSPSSTTTSSSSGGSVDREKYSSYADSLIKNYDEDKDGQLNKDEVKKMRRPPAGADQNNDGTITKDELIDSLSGANKVASSTDESGSKADKGSRDRGDRSASSSKDSDSSSRSGSVSTSSSSRSRGSSSSSFTGLDVNKDNQVQMHEFSDEWDDKKVEEFYAKDKNGDGVITLREWNGK